MTAENRITRTPGIKAKYASKQLVSCTSASSPLKRLVPVSTPTCVIGSFAKSPSSDSSNSGCEKRGRNAAFNRKALTKSSRGTKDALEDVKLSTSECSSESTSSEFEASNELLLKCTDPDETKCVIAVAEPKPGLRLKDLDVLHSNLAANWFSIDDQEFDDMLNTKTDQNPDITGSKKHISLSGGDKSSDSPDSIPDSTNSGHNDEFRGPDCKEYSMTTSPQDKETEEGKVVEIDFTNFKTPDVKECSKRKSNFEKYEVGPAILQTSEGTRDANAQQDTNLAKADGNLLRLEEFHANRVATFKMSTQGSRAKAKPEWTYVESKSLRVLQSPWSRPRQVDRHFFGADSRCSGEQFGRLAKLRERRQRRLGITASGRALATLTVRALPNSTSLSYILYRNNFLS